MLNDNAQAELVLLPDLVLSVTNCSDRINSIIIPLSYKKYSHRGHQDHREIKTGRVGLGPPIESKYHIRTTKDES